MFPIGAGIYTISIMAQFFNFMGIISLVLRMILDKFIQYD
jgi:hypothetical protein